MSLLPFNFDLHEHWGNIDYRFRGSYIFDSDWNAWFVEHVEPNDMYVSHHGEGVHVDSESCGEFFYGVPEHGWSMADHVRFFAAKFPERKWKYGYQPEVDSMCSMGWSSMRELARPVSDADKEAFLKGHGVFSRKIAASNGHIHCLDRKVGKIEEGVIIINPEFDFLMYEFPEEYEVVVK